MKNVFPIWISVIVCLLYACNPNKITDRYGKVRLVNASYWSGDIQLKIDYQPMFATLVQYLNYSKYADLIATRHPLTITNSSGAVLWDTAIHVQEQIAYSVFAYDSLNTIKFKLIADTLDVSTQAQCKIRFLQLSRDPIEVDVIKTNDTNFTFKQYGNGQYSAFRPMSPGFASFDVKLANTQNVLYNYYGYNFKAGGFYTVYLKGSGPSSGKDSLGIFTIENHLSY